MPLKFIDLEIDNIKESLKYVLRENYNIKKEVESELTPVAIKHLPLGVKTMIFIMALRFLTDHLEGDKYFRVHRDNHNLDRCRTQLALVKSIEDQEGEMLNFVKKWHRS